MSNHALQFAKDLSQGTVTTNLKEWIDALSDLRERIEIFHGSDYKSLLSVIFPHLCDILVNKTEPQLIKNDENKCRHLTLEILSRLPQTDVLKSFAPELVQTTLKIVEGDNEENALIALRVIFEAHKSYRLTLESQVQPFLDIVILIYKNLADSTTVVFGSCNAADFQQQQHLHLNQQIQTIRKQINDYQIQAKEMQSKNQNTQAVYQQIQQLQLKLQEDEKKRIISSESVAQAIEINHSYNVAATTASAQDNSASSNEPKKVLKSLQSFNILMECPVVVMLLFQFYSKYLQTNIPKIVPLMMQALSLRIPHVDAHANMSRFKEFIGAQIKTLSFMTYLLRGYGQQMQIYDNSIAMNVINLLKVCPNDATTIRKELLVATRHILATDFRRGFYPLVNTLLSDQLFVGVSEVSDALRPLAYSTFADLIHHIRDQLEITQLSHVIFLFSRIIHDSGLPITVHATSVRLFLTLVEYVTKNINNERVVACGLLREMLSTLVHKFDSCRNLIHSLEEDNVENADSVLNTDIDSNASRSIENIMKSEDSTTSSSSASTNGFSPDAYIFNYHTIMKEVNTICKTASITNEGGGSSSGDGGIMIGVSKCKENPQDIKQLIKAMLWGIKSIVQCIFNSNSAANSMANQQLLQQQLQQQQLHLFNNNSNIAGVPGTTANSANPSGESQSPCLKYPYDDLFLLQKLFSWALECSKIYWKPKNDMNDKDDTAGKKTYSSNASNFIVERDVKEYLELFSSVYTAVEPDFIRVILGKGLDTLNDYCCKNTIYLTIPQYLLANSKVTVATSDILTTFMMSKMHELAHPITNVQQTSTSTSSKEDKAGAPPPVSEVVRKRGQQSTVLLRIFKMTLGSLSPFPENEKVIRPRLRNIIQLCLRLAHSARAAVNYYFVFRTLFRAISGGKFENSFNEIIPLLPMILSGLNYQLRRSEHDTVKNIILELCLTIPVKLQTLLPHLPILLDHLASALQAKGELPNLALRTLEFWIENLYPEFLHGVLTSQPTLQASLMCGICKHLRPAPYPYGILALRILGKLGGRNRSFLRDFFPLEEKAEFELGLGPHKTDSDGSTPCFTVAVDVDFASSLDINDNITSRDSESDSRTSVLKLDLDQCVTGACRLIQVLAMRAPVESEVISLISSYPEMASPQNVNNGDKEEEKFNSIYDTVNASMKQQYDKDLMTVSSGFNTDGSTSRTSDNTSHAAQMIFDKLQCENEYITSKTISNQKSSALFIIKRAIASILGLDGNSDASQVSISEGNDALRERYSIDFSGCSAAEAQEYWKLRKQEDSMLNLMKDIMSALLVMLSDSAYGEETKEFLSGLSMHFALLTSTTDVVDFSEEEQLYTEHTPGKFNESIVMQIMHSAIVTSMSDSRPSIYKSAIWLLEKWMMSLEQTVNSSDGEVPALSDVKISSLTVANANVYDIVQRACFSCYSHKSNERMAGVRTLDVLMQCMPDEWCKPVEGLILRSLLKTLEINGYELAAVGPEDVISTLLAFITSCHKGFDDEAPTSPSRKRSKPNKVVVSKIKAALLPSSDVSLLLVEMLCSDSTIVRYACRQVMKKMCEMCLCSVEAFFDDLKEDLVEKMLGGDAYESDATIPIGKVSGMTFFLTNDCFKVTNDILKFITAVIVKTESQDLPPDELSGIRYHLPRNDEPTDENYDLLVACVPRGLPASVDLRLHAIRLINAANLNSPEEMTKETNEELKHKCFRLLFKSLTDPWEEVIIETEKALQTVIKDKLRGMKYQLEKSFLTDCLKPMMRLIHDSKRLSAANLKGIEVVIKMVTGQPYATVGEKFLGLGDKFLGHLNVWTDPEKLASLNAWQPGEDQIVAAARMNLFHLLSWKNSDNNDGEGEAEGAKNAQRLSHFLERFVDIVVNIEAVRYRLKQSHSLRTPYLLPLARFLSEYNKESVGYFFTVKNLARKEIIHLLIDLVDVGEVIKPLVDVMMEKKSLEVLIEVLKVPVKKMNISNPTGIDLEAELARNARRHGIKLLNKLSQMCPEILHDNPDLCQEVMQSLNEYVSSGPNSPMQATVSDFTSQVVHRENLNDSILLCQILKRRCESGPIDWNVLETLVGFLSKSEDVDISSLDFFLRVQFPQRCNTTEKLELINNFFDDLGSTPSTSVSSKHRLMNIIITPLLMSVAQDPAIEKNRAFDPVKILESFLPPQDSGSDAQTNAENDTDMNTEKESSDVMDSPRTQDSDLLAGEYLKICSILIDRFGSKLVNLRKALIKFAWHQLKVVKGLTKNLAYLNIGQFISTYETPAKIIIQVYATLIKAYHSEHKDLVRLALDKLIHALPQRLKSEDYVKTMKWTRKVMVDESQNLSQQAHLWYLISKYPYFYYPYRSWFIPQIPTLITKLGLTSNCPVEQRQIAVSIADVVIAWEKYRQKMNPDVMSDLSVNDSSNNSIVRKRSRGDSISSNKETKDADRATSTTDSTASHEVRPRSQSRVDSETELGKRDHDYLLNANMIQVLANFLVRLGTFAADSKYNSILKLSARCVSLFGSMCDLFPMKSIKVVNFEKLLQNALDTFRNYAKHKAGQGNDESSRQHQRQRSSTPAPLSDNVLCVIMEFLHIAVSSPDRPSSLFRSNLHLIKDLLVPIMSSESSSLHRIFRAFMYKVVEICPPNNPSQNDIVLEMAFFAKFKDLLDWRLRKAASDKEASDGRDSSDGENHLPWQLLLLLDQMCHQNISWVENHGTSVLKITQRYLSEHINQSHQAQRSGQQLILQSLMEHGQEIDMKRIQPTPQMAVVRDDIQGALQSKPTLDKQTASLAMCVNLLCRGMVAGHLAQHSLAILNIITAILENSENQLLLNIVCSFILECMANPMGPLAPREIDFLLDRVYLLEKLQESSLQPLMARMARIVEEDIKRMRNTNATSASLGTVGSSNGHGSPNPNRNGPSGPIGAAIGTPAGSPVTRASDPNATAGKDKKEKVNDGEDEVQRHAWECVALMSPVRFIKERGISRLRKHLKGNPLQRLLNLMKLNLSALKGRYLIPLLPDLLFDCVDTKQPTLFTSSIPDLLAIDQDKGKSSAKKISFAANHPYVSFIQQLKEQTFGSDSRMQVDETDTDATSSSKLHLFQALSTLGWTQVDIANSLWDQWLALVWKSISPVSREKLCNSITSCVANTGFRQCISWPSYYGERTQPHCSALPKNVPQALLWSLSKLKPEPRIGMPFLGYVGEHYGAWYEACDLLDRRVDTSNPVSATQSMEILISHLNDSLEEADLGRGWVRLNVTSRWTDAAIAYESYGCTSKAQQCYLSALKGDANEMTVAGSANTKSKGFESKSAMELRHWEKGWITCAKSLSQWLILQDFSDKMNFPNLGIEAASMRSDWARAKELRESPSVIAQLERGVPHHKLVDIMLSIEENKYLEADKLCAQCVQMDLLRWQALPPLHAGSWAHKTLLYQFHRVIELRESAGIMMEIEKSSKKKVYPDLKGILKSWRLRLPDDWGELREWDAIIQWRLHIFHKVREIYSDVDVTRMASLHDIPWTIIRLAKVARTLQLYDVSTSILSRLHSDMDQAVDDLFATLREKILNCFSAKQYKIGLNLLLNTKLSYFSDEQNSELFRLKGEFHWKLQDDAEAQLAFSEGVQIRPAYAPGWLSWGKFCIDKIVSLTTAVDNLPADTPAAVTSDAEMKDASVVDAEGNMKSEADRSSEDDMKLTAIASIFKSVQCGSDEGKYLLASVLCILNGSKISPAISTWIQNEAKNIPAWNWFPVLPFLISCLEAGRGNSQSAAVILQHISHIYPQSVAFELAAIAANEELNESSNEEGRESRRSADEEAEGDVAMDLQIEEVITARSLLHSIAEDQPTLMHGVLKVSKDVGHLMNSNITQVQWLHRYLVDFMKETVDDTELDLDAALSKESLQSLVQRVQGTSNNSSSKARSKGRGGGADVDVESDRMCYNKATDLVQGIRSDFDIKNLSKLSSRDLLELVNIWIMRTQMYLDACMEDESSQSTTYQISQFQYDVGLKPESANAIKSIITTQNLSSTGSSAASNVHQDKNATSGVPGQQMQASQQQTSQSLQQPQSVGQPGMGSQMPSSTTSQSSMASIASFSSNASIQGTAQTLQQQPSQQQTQQTQQQSTAATVKNTSRRVGFEIPGCYSRCSGEPRIELYPQVVSYMSRFQVVRRKGYYTYRCGFLGSDGKEYWYYIDQRGENNTYVAVSTSTSKGNSKSRALEESSISYANEDLCIGKFAYFMDWMLQQSVAARRRDLQIQQPVHIPLRLKNKAHLVSERQGDVTLMEIYEKYLMREGQETGCNRLWQIRKEMNEGSADEEEESGKKNDMMEVEGDQQSKECMPSGLKRVFNRTPADLLRNYLLSKSASMEVFECIRKMLASQLGVHAALRIALMASAQTPDEIVFSARDGCVSTVNLVPGACTALQLVSESPFRLSRNISSALSKALILGVFQTALGCSLDSMVSQETILKSMMHLCYYEHHASKSRLDEDENNDESSQENSTNSEIYRSKLARTFANEAFEISHGLSPLESLDEGPAPEPGAVLDFAAEPEVGPVSCDASLLFILKNAISDSNKDKKTLSWSAWL